MNLFILRQKPGCEGKSPFSVGICLCHGTVILDFDAVDNGGERDRLLTLV